MTTPTLGAQRVRLDFNPSSDATVARIKRAGAALIDAVNDEPGDPRLKALAMTAAEEAAMWGVKAVTTPKGSRAARHWRRPGGDHQCRAHRARDPLRPPARPHHARIDALLPKKSAHAAIRRLWRRASTSSAPARSARAGWRTPSASRTSAPSLAPTTPRNTRRRSSSSTPATTRPPTAGSAGSPPTPPACTRPRARSPRPSPKPSRKAATRRSALLGTAEVVPVLGFGQPAPLTPRLARATTLLRRAVALVAQVAGVGPE